ncbi:MULTISPECIES: hypothetical protein [Microbacterium]|nr:MULTISPECIES: hypothetical protein [Microbacterium]EPD84290.1 hypothetical protein HMPREF1529_02355 [Microbacterium sp. oral taxon 186 str. F0373]
MANPFLVLGAVAVGVVTAATGVLAVPGWVAAAQDSAAISDLAQVSAVQEAAMSTQGSYLTTVKALEAGSASSASPGVRLQRSVDVGLRLSTSEDGKAWCAVARSATGRYFARAFSSSETASSTSADDVSAKAGCSFAWKSSQDSDDVDGETETPPTGVPSVPTATPTPLPTIDPDDQGEQYPGFAPGVRNPAGIVRAGPHTVVTGVDWKVPNMGPSQPTCVTISIVGDQPSNAPWSVTLQRNGAPFYGDDQYWYATSTQVRFDVRANEVVVTGVDNWGWNPDWSNAYINETRPLTMEVCATPDLPPTVLYGDAWYGVTQRSEGEWSPTKACVALEATGRIEFTEYPFRYGWAGTLDLRDAKRFIERAGKTVNWVEFTPSPSDGYQFFITSDSSTKPVHDRYDVASGWMLPLIGNSGQKITACVHGY